MSVRWRGPTAFSAFRIRSYRFQWVADLLTSWAFEMEVLILGWFVLVTTDSPFLLAALAALHFGGTLISPYVGVIADRVDRRAMLITLRLIYGGLAAVVMLLGLQGRVEAWQLFVIAAASGIIRPFDLIVRNALIADTVAVTELRNALGMSRTTMDSARIVGALMGAGLLSSFGLGPAYGAVVGLYLASVLWSLGITVRRTAPPSTTRPWVELKSGLAYIRGNDMILAAMSFAFLANLTALPVSHGLLPVVAKNVYAMDANGLARLVAAFAVGALLGSLVTAMTFRAVRPGMIMTLSIAVWHTLVIAFGHTESAYLGLVLITVIGALQSFAMVSMSVLLLTTTEVAYRGRVSGVRMLAVYGLPMGLLLGGALIEWIGVTATFNLFGVIGLAGTALIIIRWPLVLRA